MQVVALLIAGLVVAQLVNLAVVLLLPPPRPPIYTLGEIAAALEARPVQPRLGPPLVRAETASPPADSRMAPPRARRELAALLGAQPDAVRLSYNTAPMWAAALQHLVMLGRDPQDDMAGLHRRPFRRMDGPGFGPPTQDGPPQGGPAPGGPPPRGPPPMDGRFGPRPFGDPAQRPLYGDFTAALRLPNGSWATVTPAPGSFPSSWQWRIILWFVACIGVFSLVGILFARRMTAPFGAFAAAAERLGRDPRGPPLDLTGPAELGAVARAFNEMQVRIKRYVEDRTAMVGAISHDLRTPLTRIRFKLEGAEPALRANVLADVEQMEDMISAVLVFIRDANAPARRERLDLLSLIECEVDGAALTGAAVTLEESQPVAIGADPVGLKRMVGNLIDNAVKYGGGAKVSLHAEGGEAVIEVADEGPGLPPEELERVFEPFYRVEASRNRDTGGVGLGLAVARSIARAHGGELVLARRTKGLVAIARLPLPAA
ncbi:HAMP domain-containing protein [Phenylobacterium montanum]|uniref:histidine kinase n=1 Tax=Phenylobacterium montanum TaxID=2823693 RepID=A0A975G4A6_9CAUL|nr:HAMP domain-containing protein [Caulobacter sp. S6]